MAFDFNKKYEEDKAINDKRQQLKSVAAQRPEYNNIYENQLSAVYDKIKNRNGFSYDAANDNAYQQMAANYKALSGLGIAGNQAAVNGLSGGYGTSYGGIVSNQAMGMAEDSAKDKQADYYLAAQQLYDADSQRLNNTYNSLAQNRDHAISDYSDAVHAYNNAVNYIAQDYTDARDNDYNRFQDSRDHLFQQYWDDVKQSNTERELAAKRTEYDRRQKEDYRSYLNQLGKSESPADGKELFGTRDEKDRDNIMHRIHLNRGASGRISTIGKMYNDREITLSEFIYLAYENGADAEQIEKMLKDDKKDHSDEED